MKTARQYCSSEVFSCREKSARLILKFYSDEESDGDWLEGEGHLSSLINIRNELAQGDLRSLYLGWLICVQSDELKSIEKEPPVPPNLGALSGPQAALVEFFRLDANLLAVAAQNSPRVKLESASGKESSAWIASLPLREKDELLTQLLKGDAVKVGQELQARFRSERSAVQPKTTLEPRTVAELLSAAGM